MLEVLFTVVKIFATIHTPVQRPEESSTCHEGKRTRHTETFKKAV